MSKGVFWGWVDVEEESGIVLVYECSKQQVGKVDEVTAVGYSVPDEFKNKIAALDFLKEGEQLTCGSYWFVKNKYTPNKPTVRAYIIYLGEHDE